MLTVFLLIATTSSAYADCIFDGKPYPTGTKIGGFECQADGTWKPKTSSFTIHEAALERHHNLEEVYRLEIGQEKLSEYTIPNYN